MEHPGHPGEPYIQFAGKKANERDAAIAEDISFNRKSGRGAVGTDGVTNTKSEPPIGSDAGSVASSAQPTAPSAVKRIGDIAIPAGRRRWDTPNPYPNPYPNPNRYPNPNPNPNPNSDPLSRTRYFSSVKTTCRNRPSSLKRQIPRRALSVSRRRITGNLQPWPMKSRRPSGGAV